MTIIRKDHIQPFTEQLDRYYRELRQLIAGTLPSANLSHTYHCEPDQFAREFTDVDFDQVADYLAHFRISVEALKRLKKHAAKPVGK